MKCPFKHQRAYDNGSWPIGQEIHMWCPDCKRLLSDSESRNVVLRLLRKSAGISTSEEQHILEKEPPA